MSLELTIRYAAAAGRQSTLESHLVLMRRLLDVVGLEDPSLLPGNWLLAEPTREESYLYKVFDESGNPAASAIAVLRQLNKATDVVKRFTVWNGHEEKHKGASASCWADRKNGSANLFEISLPSVPGLSRMGNWITAANALKSFCQIYSPTCISLTDRMYDAVFKDRPPVGWMLFLPRTLTSQEVPEARALVPVFDANKKQTGTIIVSVTDAVFSFKERDHVRAAHDIEIRLADQDILPRYIEM